MALTHVASSNWVSSTSSVTPTLPSSTAVGDLVIIYLVSKYSDASLGTDPSGWTSLGALSVSGTSGNDSGSMRARGFYRVWQSGDSMPALAPTPNNVSTTKASTYRVTSGATFGIAAQICGSSAGSLPVTLATSTNLGLQAGDFLHFDVVANGDVAVWDTTTPSASGVSSFGSMTANVTDTSTATGTDLEMRSVRWESITGTETGVLSIAMGDLGYGFDQAAVGLAVRIREVGAAITGSGNLSVTTTPSGAGRLNPSTAAGTRSVTAEFTGTAGVTGSVPVLTATVISGTQIDLSWTEVGGAIEYELERDEVLIMANNELSYQDTGLSPGTTYSYRVRARTVL